MLPHSPSPSRGLTKEKLAWNHAISLPLLHFHKRKHASTLCALATCFSECTQRGAQSLDHLSDITGKSPHQLERWLVACDFFTLQNARWAATYPAWL